VPPLILIKTKSFYDLIKDIKLVLILSGKLTKKRFDIDKLIKMSKLQYENHKERFYDRPATLHVLSIYKRSLYNCRETKIEYSSSRTFFCKMSSLLRKLARSKPRSSSYSLCIYPITPDLSSTFPITPFVAIT
jgi:hypothetical protein